jgi:hypothetical protein
MLFYESSGKRGEMRSAWIAVTVGLWGCATVDKAIVGYSPDEVHRAMKLGLGALNGRQQSAAIEVLGYPDETLRLGDDDVLIWRARPMFVQGQELGCVIKVAVRAGVVRQAEYDGNAGPCRSYAGRFSR